MAADQPRTAVDRLDSLCAIKSQRTRGRETKSPAERLRIAAVPSSRALPRSVTYARGQSCLNTRAVGSLRIGILEPAPVSMGVTSAPCADARQRPSPSARPDRGIEPLRTWTATQPLSADQFRVDRRGEPLPLARPRFAHRLKRLARDLGVTGLARQSLCLRHQSLRFVFVVGCACQSSLVPLSAPIRRSHGVVYG